MDKFLSIIESKNFDLDAESDFVDEQTFQNYIHKVLTWDFYKVDRLEYLAMSKDQNNAAIKKYVHPMENLETSLNGKIIIISNLSYYFCYFLLLPQVVPLLPLKLLFLVSVL